MFEIKTNSDGRLMMVAGKAKTSAVQAVESAESGLKRQKPAWSAGAYFR